jgi:hypothetical protein
MREKKREHLELVNLRELSNKFEMAVIGYLLDWGNRFMKKPEVENLVALSL